MAAAVDLAVPCPVLVNLAVDNPILASRWFMETNWYITDALSEPCCPEVA